MGKTFRARSNATTRRHRELGGVERVATEVRRVGGHSIEWHCEDLDDRGNVRWLVRAVAPDGAQLEVVRTGHRASNAPLRRALAALLLEVKLHPRGAV